MRALRPLQAAAAANILDAVATGHRRVMLAAPCSFGKTLTAAHLILGFVGQGKRVAFSVPRLPLVPQTYREFIAEGLIGLTTLQGSSRYDATAPITVCSIATVARRAAGGHPDFDVAIIDEAHLHTDAIYTWMAERRETLFIAMTATPLNRGMKERYDKLVVGATPRRLVEDGLLVPVRLFRSKTGIDLSQVGVTAGDYNEDELARAVDRRTITGNVVKHYVEHGEDRPALALCVNLIHAGHVVEAFIAAGVAAEAIDHNTPADVREEIFRQFRVGAVQVIVSVSTLEVGVDLPEASCLIDARPTFSKARYIQTGGRIQRLSSGKVDALYFDHAGNADRHGRLEDFAVKELRPEGKPGVGEFSGRALKYCDACDAEVGTATLRCPNCGEPLDDGVIRKVGELVEDDVGSLLAAAAAAGVVPRIAKDGTPVAHGPNRAAIEPWLPMFKANRSEILKVIQPDMFEVTV